jgi:hypothetical protein
MASTEYIRELVKHDMPTLKSTKSCLVFLAELYKPGFNFFLGFDRRRSREQ